MKSAPLLFLNVFIIATCGLIYELLAGTLSSYVLGDSVTQFSLIIGIYLSPMGVGSYAIRGSSTRTSPKNLSISSSQLRLSADFPLRCSSFPSPTSLISALSFSRWCL